MKHPLHRRVGGAVLGVALAATSMAVSSSPAGAAERKPGNTSLAEVLGADGTRLDKNWNDFDLVEAAVYAVLDAKPASPVGLLADGDTRLTAFIPNDRAFQLLVKDLKGFAPKNEKKVLKQVTKIADIDTIETILLYHVVAGATLTSPKVIAAAEDNALVKTALGKTVRVVSNHEGIAAVDKDRDARNAYVVLSAIDINRGNKQVAHGIDRVLRPIDL